MLRQLLFCLLVFTQDAVNGQSRKAVQGIRVNVNGSTVVVEPKKPGIREQDLRLGPTPLSDGPLEHVGLGKAAWWRDSNWWLVGVGAFTGGVIFWQSWETRKAVGAASRAFIAQFRPVVRIRNVAIRGDSSAIDFTLANVGRSSARVTSLYAYSTQPTASQGFSPRDYSEDFKVNTNIVLQPEKVSLQSICSPSHFDEGVRTNFEIFRSNPSSRNLPIYFWGYLRYQDESGAGRGKRFCFRYDWMDQRFKRMKWPTLK